MSLFDLLLKRVRAVAESESGTAFIEYVVVVAVAMVLILGAIQAFFGGVADLWGRLTDMVTGAG